MKFRFVRASILMGFCGSEGYAPCTLFAELMVFSRRLRLRSLAQTACAQETVQTAPPKSDTGAESVTLAHPVVLEVTSSNGSLKETVQKGQQLTWRRYDRWRYWGATALSQATRSRNSNSRPPLSRITSRSDPIPAIEKIRGAAKVELEY